MRYIATVGGRQHTIELEDNGRVRRIVLDGRELTIDRQLVGAARPHAAMPGDQRADHYSILAGAHSYEVYTHVTDDEAGAEERTGRIIEVLVDGRPYTVSVQDERSQALASLASGAHVSGDAAIRAPMPGLVSSVLAGEGEEVRRGQTVVVLEAMKMENDLTTPRAGVVKLVRVSTGQAVNQNDVLAVVGDPPGAGTADESDE